MTRSEQTFTRGSLVKCQHHDEMHDGFIGRVQRVFSDRLVVEVMNFHFKDRRVVEEHQYCLVVAKCDARVMHIVQCRNETPSRHQNRP